MVDNVIILAGGSGTRLWPASTAERPKQFLDPGTGRSLLQMTVERAAAVVPAGRILVVTHHSQAGQVREQCAALGTLRDRVSIVPEPEMRNTGPAVALGIFRIDQPAATTLVLASDHMITPLSAFAADVEKADHLAREGFLVVFGVPPTRPETGYGYIEAGEPHGPGRRVASFREKPDLATAEEFLRRGTFSWNSGMFVFRNEVMLGEFDRYEPGITAPFRGAPDAQPELTAHQLAQFYGTLPRQPLDRAVMERSDRVAMVETTFQWNDIGGWDEMADLTEHGVFAASGAESPGAGGSGSAGPGAAAAPEKNTVVETVIEIESTGNYVHADQPVALCGVDNLVVVVRNGRVLVARRGRGQLVKDVVDTLKAQGLEDLL